jgi:hypothetical protein
VEDAEEQMCVKFLPLWEILQLWFWAPVDAASFRWHSNLKINSIKFINTYLRPMVTHDKNQGREKCSSCRDICDFAQILQLPDNDSIFKVTNVFSEY